MTTEDGVLLRENAVHTHPPLKDLVMYTENWLCRQSDTKCRQSETYAPK